MISSIILIIFISNGTYTLKLTLLHVNDIHSHFEEVNINTATCKDDDRARGQCYGGVARMATYVKNIRERDPETLFLNAGDFYQGTRLGKYVLSGQSSSGRGVYSQQGGDNYLFFLVRKNTLFYTIDMLKKYTLQ